METLSVGGRAQAVRLPRLARSATLPEGLHAQRPETLSVAEQQLP